MVGRYHSAIPQMVPYNSPITISSGPRNTSRSMCPSENISPINKLNRLIAITTSILVAAIINVVIPVWVK